MFFFTTKARSTRSFFCLSSCTSCLGGEIPKSILLLSLALLLLPGCGRKTPAIPPGAVVPQAITDLRYQLDGQEITLSWSYPHLSVNQVALKDIRRFLIDRAEIPATDYCSSCPVHFSKTSSLSAQGHGPGAILSLKDSQLQPGFVYIYSVRSSSGWQIVSKPSNQLVVRVESPLASPTDLQIEVGDQQLSLSWQPVTSRLDGASLPEPARYQLWRSTDGTNFQAASPLLSTTTFRDSGLRNEQLYHYQVYALAGEKGQVRSLPSSPVSGRPLDMVPPLPPRQLSLVALPQGARLFWQASPDRDVAGYHIYRRSEGHDQASLIATVDQGAISYADTTALSPGLYYYSVAAFDAGSRHNQSARPVEVRLTVP